MQLSRFPDKQDFIQMARTHNVIPVCAEILADTDTPVGLLRKFYPDRGPVFLLESVEGGERWGRYSFLGTAARRHLRVFPQMVRVEENGLATEIDHHGDPLAVLRDQMAAFRPVRPKALPRFWGGLVGYLTYEMVSFFEAIDSRLPAEQPLAHFVIPEELVIFDNVHHTLQCVVTAFVDDPDRAAAIFDAARRRLEALLETIRQPGPAVPPAPPVPAALAPVLDDDVYRRRVARVKSHIRAETSSRRWSASHLPARRRPTCGTCTGPSATSTHRPICTFCISMN